MNRIIPKPMMFEESPNYKALSANSCIYIDKSLKKAASLLTSIFPFSKEQISFEYDENASYDLLVLKDETFSFEQYAVLCTEESLTVYSASYPGVYYAVQTLIQLCESPKIGDEIFVPTCEILDKPRFVHRGLQLDVARHFFPKEDLMRLIELMGFYKLNVLHLHLTDDQGWRIEIKKYPNLTQIGSCRNGSHIGAWGTSTIDSTPYGGFYTQEDMKDIIKFAKKRNITIIPEIDVPAHCAAAIASYSYLACRDIESVVPNWFCDNAAKAQGFENWNRPLCAGKESTYEFIYGVLDEICELFPSPFIHIGGDEAPKEEWANCPDCQQFMRENGAENVEELQGIMIKIIEDYVKSKGKRLIVWNDALKSGIIDNSVVCQYWTVENDSRVIKHAKNCGNIILSKHENLYFDMSYSEVPLQNTFFFYPTFMMIPKKYEESILGIEGELWTEWVADRNKLDFQLFPRLLALSDISWREKGQRDFDEFLNRLNYHKDILNNLGVNYAEDEISMPTGKNHKKSIKKTWYETDSDCELKANESWKKRHSRY